MSRIGLFLLLVFVLPSGIFWASHGFEAPGPAVERFALQLDALSGPKPEAGPDPAKPVTEKPEPADPEPASPAPEPGPPDPPEDPDTLLLRGRFHEAALAFLGEDAAKHARAMLGAALQSAFPAAVPAHPYLIVETASGDTFEGFAEERYGVVKLTGPAGESMTFPDSVLARKKTLEPTAAVERIAERVEREGRTADRGVRVFALIESAFAIGRPELVPPLLDRALEMDDEQNFLLSAIRSRVPVRLQADVYRALRACQLPQGDEQDWGEEQGPVVRTPRRLGGDKPRRPSPLQRSTIKSAEAIELMRKASPLREEGEKLYRKTAVLDVKDASIEDIDRAIEFLDQAAKLYEKAMEIEDADEIDALLRHCSKQMFRLRFWRQQVEGR